MADQGATATQKWPAIGARPQLPTGNRMVGNSSPTGPTIFAYGAQSTSKVPGMVTSGVSGRRKVMIGGTWRDL